MSETSSTEQQQLQNQLSSTKKRLATLVEKNRELRSDLSTAARNNKRMVEILNLTREEITTLKASLERAAEPPFNFATVLEVHPERAPVEGKEIQAVTEASADILYSGRKIRTHISALLDKDQVTAGSEVLLDEHLGIIAVVGASPTGELARVKEVLDSGLLVVTGRADDEHVMRRSTELAETKVRIGDCVTVDYRSGYALHSIPLMEVQDVVLEEVPDVTYDDVGGLGEQIEQIRDSVELPFKYPELYREHGLQPPKGILLYGPPGTGKTLIAKAVANSLADREDSADHRSYFLNIKGPELLNKYVGETERHIRTIFARAREKASDGFPVVIFFDEMESLFRVRGSGMSSDVETTIVPQLLAEIDGVEQLNNVIVIGASNREDMIDPAILRPGRLDVKIRVDRPDEASAADVFSKYITTDLPIHPDEITTHGSRQQAVDHMINVITSRMYSQNENTQYVEVTYTDGTVDILHFGDFVSGATISNVVDRAKKYAIKDYLAAVEESPGAAKGLRTKHLLTGMLDELSEQLDLPTTGSPQEWMRVSGFRGKDVSHLRSIVTQQPADDGETS